MYWLESFNIMTMYLINAYYYTDTVTTTDPSNTTTEGILYACSGSV